MTVPTLSEFLLEERATAAAAFKTEKGTLDGFDDVWKAKETEALVTAKASRDAALAKAPDNTEGNPKPKPKETPPPAQASGLKRSMMTTEQKTTFIEENGEAAYRAIPWC